jgi:hypothetical protein
MNLRNAFIDDPYFFALEFRYLQLLQVLMSSNVVPHM